MGLFDKLFNKKNKEEKFSIPDTFEVDEKQLSHYDFMVKGKSYTSPYELQRDGKKIDRQINEYKQTLLYKILSCNYSDLDFKSIHVIKSPYKDGDIDLTLKLKNEVDEFKRCLFNPSLGVGIIDGMVNKDAVSVGMFLHVNIATFMNIKRVKYNKGRDLVLEYKLSFLKGEKENDNEEMVFVSNVEKKNVRSISEYLEQKEEEKKYELYSLPKNKTNKLKGVVIKNLKINERELEIIDDLCKESESFEELAFKLYEKHNILFISKMNGVIIIEGSNKNENCIYTTLNEEDLSEGLKALPKLSKVVNKSSINYEEVIEEENVMKR